MVVIQQQVNNTRKTRHQDQNAFVMTAGPTLKDRLHLDGGEVSRCANPVAFQLF